MFSSRENITHSLSVEIKASPEQQLRAKLLQYEQLVSPLVADHSTVAMRRGLRVLQALNGDLSSDFKWISSQIFEVKLSNQTLALESARPVSRNYFGLLLNSQSSWRSPMMALFPADEPANWQGYYQRLVYLYKKQIETNPTTNTPYLFLFLPEQTTQNSWVTSFGPLRIISPHAKQLFKFGVGYHPHHEQMHAEHQLNRPHSYYKFLNSLTLYDEAFAILESLYSFRRDYVAKVQGGHQIKRASATIPGWPDQTDFLQASGKKLPINILPAGNEARRAALLGAAWNDMDAMLPIYNQYVATDKVMPDGNEHMYLSQLLDLELSDLKLKPFAELLSPHFDSSKYPQYMCFALFIEEITACLGWNLNIQIDEWNRSGQLYTFTEEQFVEALTGCICAIVEKKPKLGLYKELASQNHLSILQENLFEDFETYCESSSEVSGWELNRKEELFWQFLSTNLIGRLLERYKAMCSLHQLEQNPEFYWSDAFTESHFTSQDKRIKISLILHRIFCDKSLILRDLIESWWLEKGPDLIRTLLEHVEIVSFLDLEALSDKN